MELSKLPALALVMAVALLAASCQPAPTTAPRSSVPEGVRQVPARVGIDTKAEERAVAPSQPDRQRLLAFGQRIGLQCRVHDGRFECVGGKPENGEIYDVELMPTCGADGFFGGVTEEAGAQLRDALAPTDEQTLATLTRGQIICIQAIARAGQQPAYFYVTTIPASAIAACRNNRLCDMYGDRKVQLSAPAVACPPPAQEGQCAAGWIDADMVEAFENGM